MSFGYFILLVYKPITFASKACLNISTKDFANLSDLPVSVAYKIVHFTLFAIALPISLAENLTALFKKYKFLIESFQHHMNI